MVKDQSSARVNILGVGVSAVSPPSALARIDGFIKGKKQTYVCVTSVHGVIESQTDPELRAIHNKAGLVVPDGMPLVWTGRLKGYSDIGRVAGPDLLPAVCEYSVDKGYRHFFYGGGEGVAQRLREVLCRRFPGLEVVGECSPPFRSLTESEEREISDLINAAEPDIVWVGLSTPKQERWMAAFRPRLKASTLIGVGAAFDFNAEIKRMAPRWMRSNGLEWFFRLITEPRRLWWRYLVVTPRFIPLVFLQILRLRRYSLHSDNIAAADSAR